MDDRCRAPRYVASTLVAALLALPLPAQELFDEPELEVPSGPMEEEAVELEPDLTGPAEGTRQGRLDTLFAALSDPRNADWQQTEAEIWRTWSRSGSASMDLLLRRADSAAGEGDLGVALTFLNDLVRLAPDFAEGWNKRATLHFMRGELGRSVADIERALALEPRHFGALSGLAIILEQTGNEVGALRAWRRALDIHPNLENAAESVERLRPEVEGRTL